jgi:BA14K-like protein
MNPERGYARVPRRVRRRHPGEVMFKRTLALITPFAVVLSAAAPAKANGGDALLGGVAGFAVGTLFGTAVAQPRYYAPAPVYVAPPPPVVYQPVPVYYAPAPWTPDWYAYCARRFGSFDPRSGTYLGFDGYRHLCD